MSHERWKQFLLSEKEPDLQECSVHAHETTPMLEANNKEEGEKIPLPQTNHTEDSSLNPHEEEWHSDKGDKR